jgi:hypothetical protein
MPASKRRKPKSAKRKRSLEETRRQASGHNSLSALEMAIANDAQLLAGRLQLLIDRKHIAIRQGRSMLTAAGWKGLLLLPTADIALTACGAGWPETKNMPSTLHWPEHLRWGLDQFAEIQRLLAAGLTYGALMTTRLFLERWTINIAIHESLSINEGEAESAFINRVWATTGELTKQNMGDDWAWLSECLHGRDEYQEVLSSALFIDGSSFSTDKTIGFCERISTISVSVLQIVFAGIHNEIVNSKIADLDSPCLVGLPVPDSELLKSISTSRYFTSQFAPLDPLVVFSNQAKELVAIGRRYRKEVSSPEKNTQKDFLSALLERRGRSIELATKALTTEAMFHDPVEGRAYLLARLFRYGAIAQGALLVAGRSPKPEAQALRTAAAALESTWKLWLDDADTCLGCCRGLLEKTARARVHRLKPDKAKKMEESRNGPNRWIEEARLKRLNDFGRALGEFSHIKLTSRRVTARKKLTDFQVDSTPHPEQTARLHALDTSAYFLAKEVYSRLSVHYPKLSEGFLRTVTLLAASGHEAFEDDSMNRALKLRDGDWGDPDFSFF